MSKLWLTSCFSPFCIVKMQNSQGLIDVYFRNANEYEGRMNISTFILEMSAYLFSIKCVKWEPCCILLKIYDAIAHLVVKTFQTYILYMCVLQMLPAWRDNKLKGPEVSGTKTMLFISDFLKKLQQFRLLEVTFWNCKKTQKAGTKQLSEKVLQAWRCMLPEVREGNETGTHAEEQFFKHDSSTLQQIV